MVLENLQVKHKTFGDGTVISVSGKYMTIKFDSVTKNFVYPDSFDKFLTLSDGTVSDEILNDLAVIKEQKQNILRVKEEENIRTMTHGIVIPGRGYDKVDEEDGAYKNTDAEE